MAKKGKGLVRPGRSPWSGSVYPKLPNFLPKLFAAGCLAGADFLAAAGDAEFVFGRYVNFHANGRQIGGDYRTDTDFRKKSTVS